MSGSYTTGAPYGRSRRHVRLGMLIKKARIVEILRSRGQDLRAEWVDRELPDEVDTERHTGLLVTLRLTPADLSQQP